MSIRFSSDVEARNEACMPAAFLLLVFFFLHQATDDGAIRLGCMGDDCPVFALKTVHAHCGGSYVCVLSLLVVRGRCHGSLCCDLICSFVCTVGNCEHSVAWI